MPAASVVLRQCSHQHATCSSRQAPQPLPTAGRNATARHNMRHVRACRSTSADNPNTLTSLQSDLEAAVSAEDYQTAAKLRDELTKLQQDGKAAVMEANRKFYAAFEHSSIKAMSEIWGHGDHLQCMHPATNCVEGREDVLESWHVILTSIRGDLQITLEDVRVHAMQDTGYVTCVEVMNLSNAKGRTIATNIFEKQNGTWKIVLHQGGPLPSTAS